MALQKRCWQMHSAVTPKVRLRKQPKARVRAVCAKMTSGVTPKVGLQKQPKARVHAVCGKMTSGQLPFLGLCLPGRDRAPTRVPCFEA